MPIGGEKRLYKSVYSNEPVNRLFNQFLQKRCNIQEVTVLISDNESFNSPICAIITQVNSGQHTSIAYNT